jgi:hypothetical protein
MRVVRIEFLLADTGEGRRSWLMARHGPDATDQERKRKKELAEKGMAVS